MTKQRANLALPGDYSFLAVILVQRHKVSDHGFNQLKGAVYTCLNQAGGFISKGPELVPRVYQGHWDRQCQRGVTYIVRFRNAQHVSDTITPLKKLIRNVGGAMSSVSFPTMGAW